jgi:hypothetical protein
MPERSKCVTCEALLGKPVSATSSLQLTAKIYVKGEIKAQLSFKDGTVYSGLYSAAYLENGVKLGFPA